MARGKKKKNKRAPKFQGDKMVNINEIQLKINDSFVFRRFEKIDWKQIASLNMEQLKVSRDWDIIEKNLCNILCCHLESEFKQSDLDPNVCKLFQLAQISIEYLLQIRQQILTELQKCEEKMQTSQLSLGEALKAKEQAEKKLKELKKESKKPTNQQHYYRCPACPKTFFNGEYLHGHWQRRHPEYVTVISSNPAATAARVSPVQPSTPVKETFSPVPPVTVSSPIKTCDTPGEPYQNKEISELKERLQLAEAQLQNEQQLLHSVIEKMEKSNVNLQDMLAQEVEKICATLQEKKVEQLVIPAEAPYSPQKTVQSSSVQTTPRMFHEPETPAVTSPLQRSHITNKTATQDVMTTPTPSVRSVYKSESMSLTQISGSPQQEDKFLSHSSPSSSIGEHTSEDEKPRIEMAKPEKKKAVHKVNRQVLMDRFKKTIENALGQRMQLLGVDVNRKTLSNSTFRLLSEKLKSNQTADYLQMRNRFESQLKERLKNIQVKSPTKSHEKPVNSKPLLTVASNNRQKRPKMEQEHPVITTPVRAPVPTPRSRNQITEPPTSLSLMARDGEAHSVLPSCNVKELTAHLERQINETVLVDPPVNSVNILRKAEVKEPEKAETEEDSFSFSSLDAILTELKKPNRLAGETATPLSATKSVQWRVPVETAPDETLWDSP
ncbi:cilium assembly protein DZIP1L-like [Daphnia carinata]|uniref:cilium assembly protein DZIP1L-like n=1 Tax=Daphnia carinata TaxID=120202 RepID=UPI00286937B1|nr:cilium assembly protein DZIP1L-like [Daphnia carinata]